jgi:hypothetical protein
MDSTNGILLGKIGFYVALAALVLVLIIKKRKQTRTSRETDKQNKPNNK